MKTDGRRIKLGCCIDLADLKDVCDLGYDFVDLSGKELANLSLKETDHLRRYLQDKGIPCMGIHAALPGEIALVGPRYSEEALRQYMGRLAERARRLQVSYIGIGSPVSRRLEEGMQREAADGQMAAALETICEAASGITILLESLNREETNYINSLQEAYALKKQVKKENIGLVWDIYHFMKEREPIEELSRELLAEVRYLHIADPMGRRYPSSSSSLELFEMMKKAAVLTGASYLAVEAVSEDIRTDALQARAILRQQLSTCS